MKKLQFLTLLFIFIVFSATAKNLTLNNTQYYIWHYFDNALTNGDNETPIGATPYYDSGTENYIAPNIYFCNRGIGAPLRNALSLDNTNSVFYYDVSELGTAGWYMVQIDGDFKIEMSTNQTEWITMLTAASSAAWTNKSPGKSASPYNIDISRFLPGYDLYVRFSDNGNDPARPVNVYNALISDFGYPNFYGGGCEPYYLFGGGSAGDQQFLYIKNQTNDRNYNGRYADGNIEGINGQSNIFVYKFDLPDDNDNCYLIAYVSQQYKIEISKTPDFSDVYYSTQSLDTADTRQRICVNLKSLLENSTNNVVYFKMGDADNSNGWGGNLKQLWIAPQFYAGGKSFSAVDENEVAIRWDDNNSAFLAAWGIRFTDQDHYISYKLNLGSAVKPSSFIRIDTGGGFLWQGSSNGTDWVDLFVRGDGNTDPKALFIYPVTGQISGEGAVADPPVLLNPSFDGWNNVIFLRMKDVTPSDGNGGQLFKISVQAPVPATPINTIYPVWHYFDAVSGFNSSQVGGIYYLNQGIYGSSGPSVMHPSRGINTPGRYAMYMDDPNNIIMSYPIGIDCTQAWYVLQVDNQFSVQLSNDKINWTPAVTPNSSLLSSATKDLNWFDKGISNMAPYYFDLAALGLLPASNVYVKLGDAVTGNGWGAQAWNALITKRGYPYFLAGGNEPDTSGINGDQQWLFTKTSTSDRLNYGRWADGTLSFSYKFDLPDHEDNCTLHATMSGIDFLIGISTNYEMCCLPDYEFTAVDIVMSNTVPYTNQALYLTLPLSNILAKTDDNLIYVVFKDTTPSNGFGPNLVDFWIADHHTVTQAVIYAATEDELPFLWQNSQSDIHVENDETRSRQVMNNTFFAYVLNIINIADAVNYNFEIGNEFAIDVSTNNVDWFNIFSASGNVSKTNVAYNPYTGETFGPAAVSNAPVLFTPGDAENKIYFRFRDAVSGDDYNCSLYKVWTEDAIPEPAFLITLLFSLALLFKKFI